MSGHDDRSPLLRRTFLSRFGTGAAAFGAAFGAGSALPHAQAPAETGGRWQPVRHPEDEWLDQTSAKHRFFFDTTSANAFAQAIAFANNYFTGNRTGYNLGDTDLAVVICARHQSTAFAYTDAMWAKYGAAMAERAVFTDPKTKEVPTINAFLSAERSGLLASRGTTLDDLMKKGVRFAVCQMATRALATRIAEKAGTKVDDVYKELVDNRVATAHMVAAGIVAVNRAQEHGYSFSYVQ